MEIRLHNTLTGKKEVFKPIHENKVGIYSCGPTVYWNQHIGHMYAYVEWDALVRSFKYLDFETKWVMNLTDVGHLTSDEDEGEDKMEKGAQREGVSVWDIADKYIAQFKESLKFLNVSTPDILCRATEHIPEQIDLIKKIEANGFAYKTKTGLVFDTEKFPGYADFAHLNLENQDAGSRVTVDEEKKKPWDFLLWIVNQPNHIMKWQSPWGVGFPGWHIECTAMSTKYLGEIFDIHTGGKEHIPVHHTNEVAQGFGAFGHHTANFWLHNEWLMLDGQKISKSLGNSILVTDLIEKGFDPLSLRYLILTTHYKTGLNFTWESLTGAQTAYFKLKQITTNLKAEVSKTVFDTLEQEIFDEYKTKFSECIADDLGIAKSIGLVWQIVKDKEMNAKTKLELILDFDKVLGLSLDQISENSPRSDLGEIPDHVLEMKKERDEARASKNFQKSDELRKEIEREGYILEDKNGESLIKKNFN
ncbi:MAG: cysteine--tRNA ligase [Patescibacteria group bacterium]